MPFGRPMLVLDIPSVALRDGRLLRIVVRAYFDGSADKHREIAITFAGICATDEAWPRLEREWRRALSDINDVKEWHTAHAFNTMVRSDFIAATMRLFDALGRNWDEMAFSSRVTVI